MLPLFWTKICTVVVIWFTNLLSCKHMSWDLGLEKGECVGAGIFEYVFVSEE